jgi:hypothetical protein
VATNNSTNTTLAGQSGTGTFVGSVSPTITTPVIAQINDPNGHAAFTMQTGFSNAANYINVANTPAGSGPEIQAIGADTNVNMLIRAKGAGAFIFLTTTNANMIWYTGTSSQHVTQWITPTSTNTRNVTLPDASGTLLMTGTSQAIGSINFQRLTAASGIYTATAGTIAATFELIGGGASGGGTGATTAGQCVASGGGGGGGYQKIYATAAQIAGGVTFTVGTAGTAPTAGSTNGTAGGNTTITIGGGTAWVANGGGGGAGGGGAAPAAQVPGGTAGGTTIGTNATAIFTAGGIPGDPGVILSTSNYNKGGNGGGGLYGMGGGFGAFSGASAAVGLIGTGFGAGGGGSASVQSGGALSAGAGAQGVIIVMEFIGA